LNILFIREKERGKMSAILSLVGLVFLVSGLLSVAKVTEIGLDLVSKTQIHTLPFLATYPAVWVYVVLGLVLLAIAAGLRGR
jgi:uncharacterized membrane protein YkgB